ncbi:histone-like nucleoid-structuring protein Lsr2 [Microlunatus ginsengisoli]|uniref:histone-like nucleoid-structuring protein Lsr2 n=1 Tax=Microlunatus ginsengisoli TaxID=363863 RepID=UPI003CD08A51
MTLIDDLDHREIEADGHTIKFAYQGIQYEIDLSEKNAKKLDKALAPFLAAAHRVSTRAPQPKAIAAGVDTKAARKWAESHGHTGVRPRPHPYL